MQVTLENLSGLERKLTITVPKERVAKEALTRLQKIAPKAKLAGFRPGKIPFAVIQQRFGDSAREEAIGHLIHESYSEALKQENLRPASYPRIDVVTSKVDEPLSFTATFETYPEIKLTDLTGIEVNKLVSEVSEQNVEEALEQLRKEHVTWKEITDPAYVAKAGDQLTIDFTVSVHSTDKPIPPKTEKNVKFVLGSGFMWPEFEAPLYKSKVGDEVKFTLKFPLTHIDKELVGKHADFVVKVLKLCEPIYPELNGDLAKKLGVKDGNVASLKTEVRQNMERDLQQTLKSLFKAAVLEKLSDWNQIEVPKYLVAQELKSMQERWEQNNSRMPAQKKAEFPKDAYTDRARRFVTLGLLLSTVIKDNGIKVEPQELKARVEELASVYDDAAKVVNWYYSDKDRMLEVESTLLEEKAVDHISKQLKIVEKPVSYKDVVSKRGR